jgi:hypothetical protein
MSRFAKLSTLLLAITLAIPLMLVIEPSNAQSIPKPSVPQFTLRFVNNSYFIPEVPHYEVDPYTGQQKYLGMQGGYLVKNNTIEITIKSQPFPSSVNDTALQLYYNIRAKGAYEQSWGNLNLRSDDQIDTNYLPTQQNSEYTIIPIPANTYTPGGTVQFQVRAILGGFFSYQSELYPYWGSYFSYEASDWSGTQSITITGGSNSAAPAPVYTSSPTNNPTATSTSPCYESVPPANSNSFSNESPSTLAVVTIVVLVAVVVGLLLYVGRLKRQIPQNSNP